MNISCRAILEYFLFLFSTFFWLLYDHLTIWDFFSVLSVRPTSFTFSASPFPTTNATLNAPIFLANDAQMSLLSLQVYPLILSSKEKGGSENEVIRVCLLQTPLVNTGRNAVMGIWSTSPPSRWYRCASLCICIVCFHFHGLPIVATLRTVQFETLIKTKGAWDN